MPGCAPSIVPLLEPVACLHLQLMVLAVEDSHHFLVILVTVVWCCYPTCLDENLVDHVTFKRWVSVDRGTLETLTVPVDEFVEIFCDKLRPHCFIASEQARFFKECKSIWCQEKCWLLLIFPSSWAFKCTLHRMMGHYL